MLFRSGPASDTIEVAKKLIEAGMNVARFNMSHGDHSEHAKRIKVIRDAASELNASVGILLDTKGPEVRLKRFKNGQVYIKERETFTFTGEDVIGDEKRVSVSYPNLAHDLKKGDIVMVNDGLLKFVVLEINGKDILCECIRGGMMSDKKGMNFPDVVLEMEYISKIDYDDIIFGIEQNVDFIAASFVSNASNIHDIRNILKQHNMEEEIDIIAKIENSEGVKNIDEIFEESDGIMIARGDMGVEIPFQRLPAIQKMLVNKSIKLGKRVIVATEMLESMISNPRPTRAETNDVANAVYEGASAIMLSGETAAGKYPVECVQTMSNIAFETEKQMDYYKQLNKAKRTITNSTDAISHACCNAAHTLGAKLIFVFTSTGYSARKVSRFRPEVPIIAMVLNKKAYQRLSITWGIYPNLVHESNEPKTLDEVFELINEKARDYGCKPGDKVITTCGWPLKEETNFMKIITIK